MKKLIFFSSTALLLLSISLYSFTSAPEITDTDATTIKWYTMEEALAAQKKVPKKLFIDTYTDWCGWCKVMDEKTFTDPKVIKYVNKNFYPVKFNAEQREPITFKGKTYNYLAKGRRGIHELAYALLDRQASYPSFILLNENLDRLGIIKGYKVPEVLISTLQKHLTVQ